MRHPRGIWNLCLEESLWLDHAAMVCLRQIYCSNEPGCLLFQGFKCWLFQQQSHWNRATAREPHLPTAAARDAQVFGWIWSVGNNWQNWVAEEQKMDLKSSFEIQFKSKEHKVSLTHRWFLWQNMCIIFYIKFSSYFQLVLYAVSWTDSDFSELNAFPLSESKQCSNVNGEAS